MHYLVRSDCTKLNGEVEDLLHDIHSNYCLTHRDLKEAVFDKLPSEYVTVFITRIEEVEDGI